MQQAPHTPWERLHNLLRMPSGRLQTGDLFLAILIGAGAGYGAVCFRYALRLMQWVFYRHGQDVLSWIHDVPWWQKLLL
ncbi:MAG: hypothetical protein AB7D57_08510, partial [Desulfovibrionaceae bacterium]